MKYNRVSKKYIINIKEYMENFLGIKYEGKSKLTHNEMNYYLIAKQQEIPTVVSLYRITEEDVLRGTCLFVKDETNKVLPYANPERIEELMPKLLLEQEENDFSQRRKKCLEETKQKRLSLPKIKKRKRD